MQIEAIRDVTVQGFAGAFLVHKELAKVLRTLLSAPLRRCDAESTPLQEQASPRRWKDRRVGCHSHLGGAMPARAARVHGRRIRRHVYT